jgi:hypothetical protein
MVYFKENQSFEQFLLSLCFINSYNYSEIWTKLVHYIDNLCQQYNEENDTNMSFGKYFNDNFDNIDEWFTHIDLDISICEAIKVLYQKKHDKGNYKITSRIGIISLGGQPKTIELLEKVFMEFHEYEDCLTSSAPGYYLFETFSENSSEQTHLDFIAKLEVESKKVTPTIFVKVEYSAKIF